MFWVILFAAIAAAGLLMLVGYAIWLAHKASDVFAELKVLGERSGRIAETLSRIEIPAGLADPGAEPLAATPARSAGRSPDQDDPDHHDNPDHQDNPDQNATGSTAPRGADDVG